MGKTTREPDRTPFETPKDGDRILITFAGHRLSWYGPFIYREHFDDPEKGSIVGACIYSEIWDKKGQFARPFQEVEFWQVWEGETLEAYEKRKDQIVEELRRQNLPIDPIDSFFEALFNHKIEGP